MLNPPAAYTGSYPSAVERQDEPGLWQLTRVRVYVGAC